MTRRHVRWASAMLVAVMAALITTTAPAQAQPSDQPAAPAVTAPELPLPQIAIADVTEDNQRLLRATVTLAGKPLEGIRVTFGATRTFGVLELGLDTTLDDGTAAVPFPTTLPGDAAGTFEAVVSVEATPTYAAATQRLRLGGVGIVAVVPEPFPHALWSSKALWPLVTVIAVLLTGVWSTYMFVISQLIRIRKEAQR
jgi:hypothetical protein